MASSALWSANHVTATPKPDSLGAPSPPTAALVKLDETVYHKSEEEVGDREHPHTFPRWTFGVLDG